MNNGKKFAFLGKSLSRFVIALVIMTIGLAVEKFVNYRYVIIQKEVQSGNVIGNWQDFMILAGTVIFTSLILRVIKVFFTMWLEKTQKINFFKAYNGVIQEDGKLQGAMKDLVVANAKGYCTVETIETIISSIYIVFLMGVVSMSLPAYIGAGAILFSGISLGVVRGKLQAKTDMLGAETHTLQQKLSNFFMVSSNVLEERLKEVEGNYWKRISFQCIKNAIQVLPDLIKISAFIALFYNITSTGMAEGEIYPHTYVIITAYGYIVALAGNISNLIECVSKIILYKQDTELQDLKEEMGVKDEIIAKNTEFVKVDSGITICADFTAGLTRPNGKEASYKIEKDLILKKGEMIMLEGENGTGKSRFCKLIKEIIPNAICYDTKTSIVEKYHENFKRGKTNIDFNLIKYLAEGLDLERIPRTKREFMDLNCFQINSADKQMLIALQILYFAIKEEEENDTVQFVILDEILGNLSEERAKKIMPFISSELSRIGACTIIVSHSHKTEVRKYVSATWLMYNKENEVIIVEKKSV